MQLLLLLELAVTGRAVVAAACGAANRAILTAGRAAVAAVGVATAACLADAPAVAASGGDAVALLGLQLPPVFSVLASVSWFAASCPACGGLVQEKSMRLLPLCISKPVWPRRL